jgi:prepilin-type processing-associated H-X9-DG protein
LIAVLATVSLLALLLLPALANSRDAGVDLLCLSNLKRLTQAWHRFAADNEGRLPRQNGWCLGWLEPGPVPDNTNTLHLSNGQLAPYVDNDLSIYRCPADKSVSRFDDHSLPRVRSVSMNGYVGEGGVWTQGYRLFVELDDFIQLPPARAFVFVDEHEDSINDAYFGVSMAGFDPINPLEYSIVDFPAGYHSGGAGISFADGHAETWIWRDPRTTPVADGYLLLNVPSPNNPDVERIQLAATRKIVLPTR